jgi:hypothetical protein
VQTPAWQVSVWVQALPSLQGVSFAFAVGAEHWPVVVLQVPAVWHWSAAQTTGFEPVQTPAWHVSVCVQALPSSHGVSFALATGAEHCPVVELQVPGVWQSSAEQTTGFVPVHTPAWQVSVCVQRSPSSHCVPSMSIGFEQTPVAGSQTPTS